MIVIGHAILKTGGTLHQSNHQRFVLVLVSTRCAAVWMQICHRPVCGNHSDYIPIKAKGHQEMRLQIVGTLFWHGEVHRETGTKQIEWSPKVHGVQTLDSTSLHIQ